PIRVCQGRAEDQCRTLRTTAQPGQRTRLPAGPAHSAGQGAHRGRMSGLFDASYSITVIRFWRVPWHREALATLAEAISHSEEADRLGHEWGLISAGNRAEFALRRDWAFRVATAAALVDEDDVDPL